MTKLQKIKEQFKELKSYVAMMQESIEEKNLDDLNLDARYVKDSARKMHDIIEDSIEEDDSYIDYRFRWKKD